MGSSFPLLIKFFLKRYIFMAMGLYPHPEVMRNFSEADKAAQRDAARALLDTVRAAIKGGDREIKIKSGYYRFGSADAPSFSLYNACDLKITGGEDVELIQETQGSVIRLIGCKGVSLSQIKVDYAEMKFIQFTVCGFNEKGEPTVTVDENYKGYFEKFKEKLVGNRILYYDSRDLSLELVSSNTRGFLKELTDLGDGRFQIIYRDQITTMLTPRIDLKVGDKAVIFSRGGDHAIAIEGCESVALEDIDIYASGAFGISEHSCIGKNTYRRVRMIRRPDTDRLVCTTRDGFHSQNVKYGALIEDCEFSYAEDDLLNVHCFNGVITGIYSDTEYEITFPLNAGLDPDTDMVFINNGSITNVKVTEVERITDEEKIKSYESLNVTIKEAIGRPIRTFNTPNIYKIKLNKSVSAEMYDEVTSAGYSSAGLVVRNCYFHDSHCMAVIVTGPDATVENCRFERNGGTAVSLVRGGLWSEGPYPTKIRIANNTFTESNTAFESQYRPGIVTVQCDIRGLVHDIEIENNVFENNRVGALFAKNVSNLKFTGNRVDGYLNVKPFDESLGIMEFYGDLGSFCGLYFDGCDNVSLKDNYISEKGEFAEEAIRIRDNCTNFVIE